MITIEKWEEEILPKRREKRNKKQWQEVNITEWSHYRIKEFYLYIRFLRTQSREFFQDDYSEFFSNLYFASRAMDYVIF